MLPVLGSQPAGPRLPKAMALEYFTPQMPKPANSLGMALVISSATPLLLLDADLIIRAASRSFCSAFGIDPATIVGAELSALGAGEWAVRQLSSLLRATISGNAAIDAYEFELVRPNQPTRCLIVHATRLDYDEATALRVAVAIDDVTNARAVEKQKDDVVREKQVLLQELQHRVANSLQIIASVLMQSARRVQSDEARMHLNDAHHRVMSIATLQRQLASTAATDVALLPYLTDLCESIGASMIYDPKLVQLKATADDSTTTSEISVSLGLIVTELVINALKHAFPDRSTLGTIAVDYRTLPTGWQLTIEDNGIGMPGGPKAHDAGLGTGIVDALSKQLNATVTFSDTNPGTRIAIIHLAK